jgi:hypothetical protein
MDIIDAKTTWNFTELEQVLNVFKKQGRNQKKETSTEYLKLGSGVPEIKNSSK